MVLDTEVNSWTLRGGNRCLGSKLDTGPSPAHLGYWVPFREQASWVRTLCSSCQVNHFLTQPRSCPKQEYNSTHGSACSDCQSPPAAQDPGAWSWEGGVAGHPSGTAPLSRMP